MRDAHRFTHRCTQQLYHGLIHVSLPGSPETAIAHTELSQCGSTLLIRAKPLSGMVRITHAVAAAMAVSSGLAIADMGTTYQLQHRRVPFCSRPSCAARRVAVVEQCGSTLLIQAKPLSGMVMQCDLQCILSGSFAGEARVGSACKGGKYKQSHGS